MARGDRPHLLLVDDDRKFLEIVQFHLERAGYRVEAVTDPREGLNRAIETDFDLIILDLMMPGMSGEEVLSLLKPLSLQNRVMVVSAHVREEYRARARDLGAVAYLSKPIDPDELCRTVDELMHRPLESAADAGDDAASEGVLDRLALWVFDNGPLTTGKRLAAAWVLAGLVGVFLWLVIF